MELWSAIGTLWDQAVDGDPAAAGATAGQLVRDSTDDSDRAIALAVRALCEILECRWVDATRTSLEAAHIASGARGPLADDALYYTAAVRLIAAAMIEPELSGVEATLPLPELAVVQDYARTIDLERPERVLLSYPAIEATMSSGHFETTEELVTRLLPLTDADAELSVLAPLMVRSQLIRSLAFRGELLAVTSLSLALLKDASAHPQVAMLAEALLCYAAGQRADRKEVETRSRSVLAEARGHVNYVAVGSCLLVTWAFSAIGQVQRAAALLFTASGGPELARIKTWDRAFGYELLVTAALRRNDVAAARRWAALAEPLGKWPVAKAAVERALSRLAVATGDHADAANRAYTSATLDAMSGARLDGLRAGILYAGALASQGQRELAIQTLSEIAEEADELGATSVRKLAAKEWRALVKSEPSQDGGFASLSDREREIAILVAEGHTNRSIGSTLFLSERTVQTHLSRILNVMGLPSRTAIPAALGVGANTANAPELTDRQEQIANLVSRGYSNAQIAHELHISVKTVENHLAGIFTRWQVSSRTAVANVYVARERKTA
jgi:DNA-binding NarL/FixJ family response regulator